MNDIITSKQNAQVRLIKSLKIKKYRDRHGLIPVEGIRSVEDALDSGLDIKLVLYSSTCVNNDRGAKLVKSLEQQLQIPVLEVSEQVMQDVSETDSPQGIIVAGRCPSFDLSNISLGHHNILLVIDGVQDPGNLGTMIRTACAAGVSAVFLTKGTADVYNPKAVRATMGALFRFPVFNNLSDGEILSYLKENGYRILVADVSGADLYYDAEVQGRVAWVLGNEGRGPGHFWLDHADSIVRIPLKGNIESLNVSVAGGIILFETLRRQCQSVLTHE